MEFKGTKGKWQLYSLFEDMYSVESENGVICNTLDKNEITKANAQLIAHAPEMLEMLEELFTNYRLYPSERRRIKQLIEKATTI